MPCMCGDLYCSSCGPAQGNSRCPVCGAWTADGGCDDPGACEHEYEEAEAEIEEIGRWEQEMQAAEELWERKATENHADADTYDFAADDLAFDAAREKGTIR